MLISFPSPSLFTSSDYSTPPPISTLFSSFWPYSPWTSHVNSYFSSSHFPHSFSSLVINHLFHYLSFKWLSIVKNLNRKFFRQSFLFQAKGSFFLKIIIFFVWEEDCSIKILLVLICSSNEEILIQRGERKRFFWC